MEEIYSNIDIDFDGETLFIAKDHRSSGCVYYDVNTKRELIEHILEYVLNCVDQDNEYDFELKEL